MTQEEKAKAYDEAIEKARSLHDNYDAISTLIDIKEELEHIFPKLRESEDEKIRGALLSVFKEAAERIGDNREWDSGITYMSVVAWLEKQGAHKQFDYENVTIVQKDFAPKEEPTFKVGDWIIENGVNRNPVQITSFEEDKGVGIKVWFSNDTGTYIDFLKGYHKWTIQDAKDGDVLATDDWVFIFEKLNTDGKPKSYCHYDIELGFVIDVNTYISTGSYIRPATKEQRDLLFQKMKEAGYEWDSESKQLIIPDKLFRFEVDLNTAVERYVEQHKSELNGYFDIRRIARHFFALGLKQKEDKL